MRIAKFISHSGYCSRREAEKLVLRNKVKINSKICTNLAVKVEKNDEVQIRNKKIFIKKNIRLWKVYKPTGYITTTKDPQGRKNIFSLLPKELPRLISIGRLDINSEGLILFTNNGDFARYLELPKNNFKRTYNVRVHGRVNINKLKLLKKGILINNYKYKPINAKLLKQMNSNAWISMILQEGKNREIRKICSYLGWEVNKLIRVNYGSFALGDLKKGGIQEIKIPKNLKKFND